MIGPWGAERFAEEKQAGGFLSAGGAGSFFGGEFDAEIAAGPIVRAGATLVAALRAEVGLTLADQGVLAGGEAGDNDWILDGVSKAEATFTEVGLITRESVGIDHPPVQIAPRERVDSLGDDLAGRFGLGAHLRSDGSRYK